MMAGKQGMVHARPKAKTVRGKIWQSMRVLKHFTVPDLCRTAVARESNAKKFISRLAAHGYIALSRPAANGYAGSYNQWRLVRDTGPFHPTVCDRCGRSLSGPCDGKEAA